MSVAAPIVVLVVAALGFTGWYFHEIGYWHGKSEVYREWRADIRADNERRAR